MKIKEYIIENKEKVVLGVLGLAAIGGLVYWLTRKPTKNQQQAAQMVHLSQSKVSLTSTVENDGQQTVQSQKNRQYMQVINQIKSCLKASNDNITPQVITAIIRGQYKLSAQQVRNAILKARKMRRKALGDTLQYGKIVTKHQLQLEQIQQKYLNKILAQFDISKVTWNDANHDWQSKVSQQGEGIGELIRQQENRLLLSLGGGKTKQLQFKTLQKVLLFKIQQLEQLNIDELGFSIACDAASKYDLISTYLSDLIYQKFKIEQQDMQYSIQKLDRIPKQKVIEYEDRILDLMDSIVGQDEEDSKQPQFPSQ